MLTWWRSKPAANSECLWLEDATSDDERHVLVCLDCDNIIGEGFVQKAATEVPAQERYAWVKSRDIEQRSEWMPRYREERGTLGKNMPLVHAEFKTC